MPALNLPSNLPNISKARLPETYATAKKAIAECAKIDECKSWADKSEALASYAKQAGDDELRKMADRIQARALDRCGELLRAIPSASGSHRKKAGADLFSTRQQAADAAGLSPRQHKTALRINAVPRDQFEALVESDDPPTATRFADMGKKKRPDPIPLIDLGTRTPEEFIAATKLIGHVRRFAADTDKLEIVPGLRGCNEDELQELRENIQSGLSWLKLLEQNARKKSWPIPEATSLKKSMKSSKKKLRKANRSK